MSHHIQSLEEREAIETQGVGPYAARSSTTRGRIFKEIHPSRRAAYQRDRDRVVNSKAFRRLEYKTQVFVNGTADHYRTRLTHTIEMASVGRTLARALRANEDLTAAICLAHDLGHSPFGHCGERVLNEMMTNHGGFDHNVQSLRCVECLEYEYPDFDGLNLTWEVRAGLRKHESKIPGLALDGHPIGPFQMIEAQIADIADDITYQAHDAQDGIEAGLLTPDALNDLELWRRAAERVAEAYPDCPEERRASTIIRMLITVQVEDVLRLSDERLGRHTAEDAFAVMSLPERLVDFSPEMKEVLAPYRDYMFRNMYWHPSVRGANEAAVEMMRKLFLHYIDRPETMGRKARARIETEGLWRTACDYVAGCTDRYAFEEYQRYDLE